MSSAEYPTEDERDTQHPSKDEMVSWLQDTYANERELMDGIEVKIKQFKEMPIEDRDGVVPIECRDVILNGPSHDTIVESRKFVIENADRYELAIQSGANSAEDLQFIARYRKAENVLSIYEFLVQEWLYNLT